MRRHWLGKIFPVRCRGLEPAWDTRIELPAGGCWREARPERNASLVWGTLVRNLCPTCSGSDSSTWFSQFGLLNAFFQRAVGWRVDLKEMSLQLRGQEELSSLEITTWSVSVIEGVGDGEEGAIRERVHGQGMMVQWETIGEWGTRRNWVMP